MIRKLTLSILSVINFGVFLFVNKFGILPFSVAVVINLAMEFLLIVLLHKKRMTPTLPDLARHASGRVFQWTAALVGLALVIFAVKIPWFFVFKTDAGSLLAGDEKSDLLSRREYLLDRVVGANFSPESSPFFLGSVMKKEWAIGTLSMTAMALANLAFEFPETQQSAREAVRTIADRMLQDDIRSFEVDYWGEDAISALAGENGNIGYLGHLNLIFAAYRFLGGDERFEELHTKIDSALIRRINNRAFPYLETFPKMIFTADNAVVIASIALSSRIFHTDESALIHRWVDYTAKNLIDPESGGIVFYVDQQGRALGKNRGSAAGWFSFYLPFVDEELAQAQFAHLKSALGREILGETWAGGVEGIREYLPGKEGPADIDSGPVVFGLSTSGTGFAVAGARRWRETGFLQGLLNTAEFVGSTVQLRGERCYLLAPLIGDAIMLAMKTSRPWDERFLNAAQSEVSASHD